MPVRKVSGENSRTRTIRKEKMDEVGFAVSILQQEAHALTLMARGLTTTFCEIVDRLYNVKGRIAVTGMGKSGHVARKVAATLASTGSPAYFIHPGEASHGDLGMLASDDAVLAFSNSGNTAELSDIILYAARRNIPLIGVTRNADSMLGKNAAHLLLLPLVPEAVIGALRDRNIYPGLFVSYMTLALEHGLCCHGGIFLVRYLPTMLHAVRDLFMECGEPLPPLPGRTMLAAFAISMQARETGRLFPAGMLELLTSGGISRADLQRLADLPLEAVLPLSLARWCLDYTPRSQRTPAWEADLRNVAWEGLTIEVS